MEVEITLAGADPALVTENIGHPAYVPVEEDGPHHGPRPPYENTHQPGTPNSG